MRVPGGGEVSDPYMKLQVFSLAALAIILSNKVMGYGCFFLAVCGGGFILFRAIVN